MKSSVLFSRTGALFLLIVFCLAVVIRFVWLDLFPAGMYHDEIEYSLSSKRYAIQGVDLSGYGFPLSLFKTETDGIISPVAPLLLSPWSYFAATTQTSARLPFVMLNILTAVVLGMIILRLSNNKVTAALGSLLFLLNPWSFYLSRYAADSPFALFFYLSGIYLLLQVRGRYLILPFLAFLLGFFSYHGAKIIYLPLIAAVLIYRLFDNRPGINPKVSVTFFAAAAIIFAGFISVSYFIPGSVITSRSDDFIFNRTDEITRLVDEGRRLSVQSEITPFVSNKLTEIGSVVIEKYLAAFSPEVLFLHGDNRATYRFSEHGLFMIPDLFMILLGMFHLYRTNKKQLLFTAVVLAIAPVSSALSVVETSVIHRGFMMLPVMIIFAAFGITELIFLLKKVAGVQTVIAGSMILYLFFFGYFLHFYFFRFPVLSQESYFLSERVLAKFLNINRDQNTEIVLKDEKIARSVFLEYVFYSNFSNRELAGHFNNLADNKYESANFRFVGNCRGGEKPGISMIISREAAGCSMSTKPDYKISDQKDAGSIFSIYNSSICNLEVLSSYKRTNLLSDFDIEDLNRYDFCRIWINTP